MYLFAANREQEIREVEVIEEEVKVPVEREAIEEVKPPVKEELTEGEKELIERLRKQIIKDTIDRFDSDKNTTYIVWGDQPPPPGDDDDDPYTFSNKGKAMLHISKDNLNNLALLYSKRKEEADTIRTTNLIDTSWSVIYERIGNQIRSKAINPDEADALSIGFTRAIIDILNDEGTTDSIREEALEFLNDNILKKIKRESLDEELTNKFSDWLANLIRALVKTNYSKKKQHKRVVSLYGEPSIDDRRLAARPSVKIESGKKLSRFIQALPVITEVIRIQGEDRQYIRLNTEEQEFLMEILRERTDPQEIERFLDTLDWERPITTPSFEMTDLQIEIESLSLSNLALRIIEELFRINDGIFPKLAPSLFLSSSGGSF